MAVTKSHCGKNVEKHAIAGGEGIAPNPIVAQGIALALFVDAFKAGTRSLLAYAAQPCPKDCSVKKPANPNPVFGNFKYSMRYDPGAAAIPAVPAIPAQPAIPFQPAKPAKAGMPAQPAKAAQPAKPAQPAKAGIAARPAAYICTISVIGKVTFDCGEKKEKKIKTKKIEA